ncbi:MULTISPECIES: maleylpyruvate isomerase family mycothiol-dependent enzyme [unclassified Nocardioides]|uniref:maleylpyruvate isomerase family mycothiol-dependent enzyme n=1 Tax=unclassified Nocardioides TaxID=2615069 RepID=UPI00301494F6
MDQQRLATYVEVWKQAVDDLVALLEDLSEEDWSRPTDLPGWDVRAVASHTAHLESRLAGAPEETADVGEPPHVTGLMGLYTEIGVVNRRDRSGAEIVAEIRTAAEARYAALRADPPTDPLGLPPVIFGGVPWTWETLLRNRPLDVWMHEQDVRRAVGRPGGLDSAAARHTADYLAEGLGYVLVKKVGAAPETVVVLEIEGHEPVAWTVTRTGRGEPLPVVRHGADATLRMDRESFICLAGGRRAAPVEIEGDTELGQRVVDALATTP